MLSQPAGAQTFAAWLARGLGRAVLHVKRYGDGEPYRSALLHACLVDGRYDSQLEGSHARYLLRLIYECADADFYIERILSSLREGKGSMRDRWELYSLAVELSRDGYSNAAQAMWDAYATEKFTLASEPNSYAHDLLAVFGAAAVPLFVNRLFDSVDEDHRVRELAVFLERAAWTLLHERNITKEVACELLASAPEAQNLVQPALDFISQWTRRAQEYRQERNAPVTYEQMREWIVNPPGNWRPTAYGGKVRRMSKSDRRLLARDFIAETNPMSLQRYLGAFSKVRCPAGFDKIRRMFLASTGRERYCALMALKNFRHPSLHRLAVQSKEGGAVNESARLLERNYLPGDSALVAELARQAVALDADERHGVYTAIRNISYNYDDQSLAPPLLLAYENTPCSSCRGGIVDELIQCHALPDWITQEAKYDAEPSVLEAIVETSRQPAC